MWHSSQGQGTPLTVEALRAALDDVLGEGMREVIRKELKLMREEQHAHLSDVVKVAFCDVLEEMERGEPREEDMNPRATFANPAFSMTAAAMKTATDWVTKRRVNRFYTRGRKTNGIAQVPTPEPPPRSAKDRKGDQADWASQQPAYSAVAEPPPAAAAPGPAMAFHSMPSFGSGHTLNRISERTERGAEREAPGAPQAPPAPRGLDREQSIPEEESIAAAPTIVDMTARRPKEASLTARLPRGSSREMHVVMSAPESSNGSPARPLLASPTTSRGSRLSTGPLTNMEISDEGMDLLGRRSEMKAPVELTGGIRGKFQDLVFTVWFEYASCALVLMNAICVGMQTDFYARNEAAPWYLVWLDHLINFAFAFELIARICALGLEFFRGVGWLLNWFDLIIVTTALGDLTLVTLGKGMSKNMPSVSVLRNFGIIRFVRILRLTRVLAFIGELRTLVVSIASSMHSLVWVIILLALLTYSLGVVLTQVVVATKYSRRDLEPEAIEELDRLFGSVGNSMLSLFEAVSEGQHWGDVMDPLVRYCSPWLKPVFLCYIVFALFALLNVVTGLFVEAAIATAAEDKKVMIMQQMCQMFLECDDDGSGTISKEEFFEHLCKPEMENYLKELDIDTQEADMLFHLLDSDGSGEIEAEELVGGCLRLHGQAKALELAAFMHEFKQFSRRIMTHVGHVETTLAALAQQPHHHKAFSATRLQHVRASANNRLSQLSLPSHLNMAAEAARLPRHKSHDFSPDGASIVSRGSDNSRSQEHAPS